MSQNQRRILANSVNEYTDNDVSAIALGRVPRELQSRPDRHQDTASSDTSESSDSNNFSGFSDVSNLSGFSDVNNFSGFSDVNNFSGFSDVNNFSGFSDMNNFSGFSDANDFSGFTDPNDFSGFNVDVNSDNNSDNHGANDDSDSDSDRDSDNSDNHGANIDSDLNNAIRNNNSFNNRKKLKLGTWNVRTLSQRGKFEEVEKEMKRLKLDILGLSEVRWTGAGKIVDENVTFYYSGGDKLEKGVGIMVNKRVANSVLGFWAVSDRVIMVKIRAHPFNINIIQVYAPTQEGSEDDVDEFYETIADVQKQSKSQEIMVTMGDFNAKVGRGRFEDVVGPFGLGERNFRGERLISWCDANDLMITNTWYKKHPRLLWTWKSPGDRTRNQIDYITINKRFRNAIIDTRTFPGADCYSDHVPVVSELKIRLKRINKRKTEERRELKLLRTNNQLREAYELEVANRYEVLNNEEPIEGEEELDREWRVLQLALTETTTKLVPKAERRGRQKWMTEEILEKMEERRISKDRNPQRYEELNLEIRRACDTAKEEWINTQCKEIEEMEKNHQMEKMHQKIKEVTGKRKPARGNVIKTKEGGIVMEIEEVLRRWEEYVKDLFEDERGEKPRLDIPMNGPEILKEEIVKVVKKSKKGKSPGNDKITIEMIEGSGDFGMQKITELTNKIYNTGFIPEEMYKSIFIAIPKKPGAVECNLHRTISLMSQITKIILKVILNRIKQKLKPEIAEEQYGFIEGKGTRNAVFIMRMISERAIEVQKNVYMCFIDYEKAFDKVRHPELVKILRNLNLDGKDIRLITNLYWDQLAAVNIENNLSSWIEIKRGVRQGCVLSPELFAIYGEIILRSIIGIEGIRIGGVNINNIRYADDTVIIADSADKLQELLNIVNRESEKMGLKINKKKTEVVVASKSAEPVNCIVKINNEEIKQSNSFVYLGSLITRDGRSNQEVEKRIVIAKGAFQKMRSLLGNNRINSLTRVRALKTYVWSTLTYGSESWTLSRELINRLNAAEMWFYRRMLRIRWTDRITNEEVLRRIGMQRTLVKDIRRRQMNFLGHILRKEKIEHLCLTGKIEGRRARGRQRKKYLDSILEEIGENLTPNQLIQLARDRLRWRQVIANVQDTALR